METRHDQSSDAEEVLLTASQAAKRLGVSVRTLHRYELDGKVAPVRTLGGHRRYRPSDLDATAASA